MKQLTILALFTLNQLNANAQNLPLWFTCAFKQNHLDSKYTLSNSLTPANLQADFNGDSSQDVAVLISEKRTNKVGVLLMQNKGNQFFIFGAGHDFGNGSDNFNWVNHWSVYKNETAYKTNFNKKTGDIIGGKQIKLMRPAILFQNTEQESGGLIYWDGRKYIWIQQGE